MKNNLRKKKPADEARDKLNECARRTLIQCCVTSLGELSDWQKRIYYDIRYRTIAFLGGKCKHNGCEERDPANLQIHHIHPHCSGGWKGKSGWNKLKFWKNILAGTEQGELYCHEHHTSDGHDGNTSNLKK